MRNSRSRQTFTTLVVVVGAVVVSLHASRTWSQTAPEAVVFQPAPGIDGVIKAGTRPDVVVRGLKSSDDPIWLPDIGLVFSESQANRVVKLDEHDQVTTFVGDLHGPLGMTLDRKGRLISLQSQAGFAGPRVIWPRRSEAALADRFEGRPFARPNDVVSDSKGGVYFSDLPLKPVPADAMAPAVYYVPPGGSPIRVIDDIARPNGVQLSRDEKILYVNDTGGVQAFAFDVLPDGRLTNRRVFVTYVGRDRSIPATEPPVSNADGLVIDAAGRVYALTEAGIEVIKADGQHLGVIPVWCITRRCQNLTFGGSDKRTLYVAGGGTLLRIPMLSRGFAGRAK
jgi:sugar lactone lactonase YvrE